MGHPSARGLFVHLYLNGLYWGLYNPSERPSGPFVAAHLGGEPEDYDVRNGANILEGDETAWKQLMALANAGVEGEREFAALQELLDIPELIDFLIANFYGANADSGPRLELVRRAAPLSIGSLPVLRLGRGAHAGRHRGEYDGI